MADLYNTREADWKNLFLHIPFVIPIRNCYRAYQLHTLDFGEKGGVVWEIQREVAKTSLSESFYEAGPQASQQLVIGFSTGQFRWNIVLSIIVSLFQPASRTYFRNEDESDPDPDICAWSDFASSLG